MHHYLFYTLAKYVIEEKSGFVCGAAFDNNLQLRHKMISSMDEIIPLMKSKYLESNAQGIYLKVKEALNNKHYVLFVGTPCQVQALNNFLGNRKYKKLILVDFICHGVPNQKLFDKSIKEYEYENNCKVIDFSFRYKTKDALHNCLIIRRMESGVIEKSVIPADDFPFYYGFRRYFMFRESCYSCRFVGCNRISDFTLGDFWGYANLSRIKDFNKGYSQVYVNSQKGLDIFNNIQSCLYVEEVDKNSIIAENYAYLKPTKKSIIHRAFMYDYSRLPYHKLEKKYLKYSAFNFMYKLLYVVVRRLGI